MSGCRRYAPLAALSLLPGRGSARSVFPATDRDVGPHRDHTSVLQGPTSLETQVISGYVA